MIPSRITELEIVKRFARFTGVGIVALTLELVAMSLLIYLIGLTYLPAVVLSFLTIFSISYFGFRNVAFYGTKQSLLKGYFYFMLIASIGLAIITAGTYVLVEHFAVQEILARFIIGAISGTINFLINAYLNFKVL